MTIEAAFLVGFFAGALVVGLLAWLPWRRQLIAQSDFWYRHYRQADQALHAVAMTMARDRAERADRTDPS